MGRTVRHLGSLSGADMSITPDGKQFTWSTSDLPDPIQVYVECSDESRGPTPFVGGRGGAQTINWIIPGRTCTFTLKAAGKLELSLFVDTRQGFPVKTKIARAAAAPVSLAVPSTSTAAVAAPITAAPSTPGIIPAPNGELIPGIPDMYLMIGGGVLAIALLGKKGR